METDRAGLHPAPEGAARLTFFSACAVIWLLLIVGCSTGPASAHTQMARGVLLDVAKYKGTDPLPGGYWISLEDLQNTAKAQKVEIQKGDILLVRTGWRKMWDVWPAIVVA